jgi:hypothetical protein
MARTHAGPARQAVAPFRLLQRRCPLVARLAVAGIGQAVPPTKRSSALGGRRPRLRVERLRVERLERERVWGAHGRSREHGQIVSQVSHVPRRGQIRRLGTVEVKRRFRFGSFIPVVARQLRLRLLIQLRLRLQLQLQLRLRLLIQLRLRLHGEPR